MSDNIHIRIEPKKYNVFAGLKETWDSRELLYMTVWRDLKVRYKQTLIGATWAIFQPLALVAVFGVFFGRLAKMPSDGIPYPIFVMAGLIPWQMFATCVSEISNSMVNNKNLITKVYFPRLIIPCAVIGVASVDYFIAFAAMLAIIAWYGITPSLSSIWVIPCLTILTAMSSLSIGLWLSSLNVKYRDVRYIVPFLLQFGLLVTPVAYPTSIIPHDWRVIYGLNPMVGIIEGFRWALLGGLSPGYTLLTSMVSVVVLLVGGLWFFRKTEHTFADLV